jgi:hypothetical protein
MAMTYDFWKTTELEPYDDRLAPLRCRYHAGVCRYDCASRGSRCLIDGLVDLAWALGEDEEAE